MTGQTENNIKLNMIENTEKSISEHTGRNNQVRFVRKKKNTQNLKMLYLKQKGVAGSHTGDISISTLHR